MAIVMLILMLMSQSMLMRAVKLTATLMVPGGEAGRWVDVQVDFCSQFYLAIHNLYISYEGVYDDFI